MRSWRLYSGSSFLRFGLLTVFLTCILLNFFYSKQDIIYISSPESGFAECNFFWRNWVANAILYKKNSFSNGPIDISLRHLKRPVFCSSPLPDPILFNTIAYIQTRFSLVFGKTDSAKLLSGHDLPGIVGLACGLSRNIIILILLG